MRTRNSDSPKPAIAKKTPPAKKSATKTPPEPAAESATPKTADAKRTSATKAKLVKKNDTTPSPTPTPTPSSASDSKPEQSSGNIQYLFFLGL